jgi:hypothetical protein
VKRKTFFGGVQNNSAACRLELNLGYFVWRHSLSVPQFGFHIPQ